ncbi:MAG TPA: fibronectin type III domain-containing protein [Opitutaceae bacterium]|nr:fibronectin type III domain-containing protein [Opitutaceae bacterium]
MDAMATVSATQFMKCQARPRILSSPRSPSANAAVALYFLLAGISCGTALGQEGGDFAGPTDLVATMPDPYNIHLQWKNHGAADGGNMVQFQSYPEGAGLPAEHREKFLILGFFDSKVDTFRHEKLGAETVLSYRIHPYFGNGTEPVSITTGSAAAAKNEPDEAEGPLEDPEKNPKVGSTLVSLRAPQTFAGAAPTELTLSLSSATHVVLRWRDRAVDADGYLVEISRLPDRDYQVCALLPPHSTSLRKNALPPETKIYFRVRAFFYGPPSNVVTRTTGPEPLQAVETKKN